jgi:hypothetical protein
MVSIETLKSFEPIASMPEARLRELAGLCELETLGKDSDPFAVRGKGRRSIWCAAS